MATEGRKLMLLGVLLAVLALVAYRTVGPSQSSTDQSSGAAPLSSPGSGPGAATRRGQAPATAPEVHLEALSAEHPKPGGSERNLFQFKPKAPPPPPPGRATTPQVTALPQFAAPTGPPPPPPITLKFIAIVERSGKPKIAILSDGLGSPLYGTEGGVVAGRYRILRIGVESIEMSYLDGRGRQTIRLTGS